LDYSKIPSPCYVIEEQSFRRNLALISSVAQRAEVEIILAFKAFAMWSVFPVVREYVQCSTASSLSEARLAYEEMGSKAHTYAPAYSEAEFPEIMSLSSHITFNSLSQFQKFYPYTLGKNISCGLRINPEYSDVETDLYNPCAPGSRLGVVADLLGDHLPEGVEGLHFHTLCESNSFDLEKTLAVIDEKFGKYFPQIKWLNMGGGHLMTHKDYDVEHLITLLKNFRSPEVHLRGRPDFCSPLFWMSLKIKELRLPCSMYHSRATCPIASKCPINRPSEEPRMSYPENRLTAWEATVACRVIFMVPGRLKTN